MNPLALLRRLRAVEAAPDDDDGPAPDPVAMLAALEDAAAWIGSGFVTLPPESPAPLTGRRRSRIFAMAEVAGELLAHDACSPLLDRDPASLTLDEMTAAWLAVAWTRLDECSDPLFGRSIDTDPAAALHELRRREAALARPATLPPGWARMADHVDALLASAPPFLGEPPQEPDPSFL